MTDASDSELEALRALQIVENQLEEAEKTVWKASTDNEQLNNQLDDLTQEIWSLQHWVEEIQTHLE